MTTPPSDPFGTPRDGGAGPGDRPADRPSWDPHGTYGQPQPSPSWQDGGQVAYGGEFSRGGQYGPPVRGTGGPPWQGPTQTGRQAVIALACALASWVVLPVLPAIAALMIARTARQEIARSRGRLSGGGVVTAAQVVAWANLVATLLVVLLVVVAVVLFSASIAVLPGVQGS